MPTFSSASKQSDNTQEVVMKKSEADIILKLKERLQTSMNVWLTKNALHLVTEDTLIIPDNKKG